MFGCTAEFGPTEDFGTPLHSVGSFVVVDSTSAGALPDGLGAGRAILFLRSDGLPSESVQLGPGGRCAEQP